ncbi:MAG TPA: hypothetical protein PK648_00475 [Verrucomicrobiales bacterium]|nr:hypothetical protein [Verrucomicrobiales bacterium]
MRSSLRSRLPEYENPNQSLHPHGSCGIGTGAEELILSPLFSAN